MTFDEPAAGGGAGDRLQPRDVERQLLIVRPIEYRTGIFTRFNPEADAICVDVVNLDMNSFDGTPGVIYRMALWFQGQLISNMRPKLGKLMLGRITRGMGQPGQNPPYVFESATSDTTAVARAQAWLAQHPEFEAQAAPVQMEPVVARPRPQQRPQQQYPGPYQGSGYPQPYPPQSQQQYHQPYPQQPYNPPYQSPSQPEPSWYQPQEYGPPSADTQRSYQGPPPDWAGAQPAPPQQAQPQQSMLDRMRNQQQYQGQQPPPDQDRQQYGY